MREDPKPESIQYSSDDEYLSEISEFLSIWSEIFTSDEQRSHYLEIREWNKERRRNGL